MEFQWSEFDRKFDIERLKDDLRMMENDEQKKKRKYDRLPDAHYEVAVEKLELTVSKASNKPMLSGWLRIQSGEYDGRIIFYSQVIESSFQIKFANNFLKSLWDGKVIFDSYEQYAKLVSDIFASIDGRYTYELNYRINKKGFQEMVISNRFDVEKSHDGRENTQETFYQPNHEIMRELERIGIEKEQKENREDLIEEDLPF
jgi:hypothetical protein